MSIFTREVWLHSPHFQTLSPFHFTQLNKQTPSSELGTLDRPENYILSETSDGLTDERPFGKHQTHLQGTIYSLKPINFLTPSH